jgi:TonB family protein
MRSLSILLPLLMLTTAHAADVKKPALVDFRTCIKPEWPKEALRKEETGTVHMKFLVGEDGKVIDTFIQKSSGSSLLDEAAVNGIQRCGFTPATLNGVPVRGWQKMQYVWSLETDEQIARAKEDIARYRSAALTGDAGAVYQLAQLFRHGIGLPFDNDRYIKLLRFAAEHSYAEAEYELGANYNSGVILPKDADQALVWYQRAADHGHAAAQYRLGDFYESGINLPHDPAQAAARYRQAAVQGDHDAEGALGRLLEAGQGVELDTAQAAIWYRKAAEGGNTEASYRLGALYLRSQDAPRAAPWLIAAARDRIEKAEAALANLYFTGAGVPQSDVEGFKYLRRAALAGEAQAMRQLGLMLSQGLRVAVDANEGQMWLDQAARHGAQAKPDEAVRFDL